MAGKINQVHSCACDDDKSNSTVIPTYKPPVNDRRQKIKHEWDRFVSTCTLHGLHYLFERDRCRIQRTLWLIFIVAGIGWFGYQSSLLVLKYFSHPIQTKAMLVYDSNPVFPAVTICNYCSFKRSKVESLYKEILNYSTQLQRTGSSANSSSETLWDHFNLTGLNMTKEYIKSAFPMEDLLVDCRWSGSNCSAENFTTSLTGMGLCYTFNSGFDGHPILRAKQAGIDFALKLRLNVNQDEYFGEVTDLAGFKVLLHDQDSPALIHELGFSVSPGTSTFAAIRKNRVENLPYPYEDNCVSTVANDDYFIKYTTAGCSLICLTRHVVQQCGCRAAFMPAILEAEICNPKQQHLCLDKEIKHFAQISTCSCPVPCEAVSYDAALSHAAFPNKRQLDFYAKLLTTGRRLDPKNETIIREAKEFIRDNFLELNIYYQELNYNFIKQVPAYTTESLFGELGGQLGLCLGASLLTLVEFVDIFLYFVSVKFGLVQR